MSLTCPSCGAQSVERRGGVLACSYCGRTVRPRLEPGALCGEALGGRACPHLAESLCSSCCLPLCDRHNDPKTHYWRTPLEMKNLFPSWGASDLRSWREVLQTALLVPVEGFDPFEWVPRTRAAACAVGEAEERVRDTIRPLAGEVGGELTDSGCLFLDLCAGCFEEAASRIDRAVRVRLDRYRVAARGLLDALASDTSQSLQYVDAFLSLHAFPPEEGPEGVPETLTVRDPPLVWSRYRQHLVHRLDTLRTLSAYARGAPSAESD